MLYCLKNGHSDYKEWKFISFVEEFVYANNLLFWYQDLKMRHGLSLSFNSLGYIFLNYVRNSLPSFIAQSLLMNFDT